MAEPSVPTIKRLFATSGNECAFPTCKVPIIEDSGTPTGEICHISAQSPKGPRYDANQTDEVRHGYQNLLLLCRRHHKIIDSDADLYDIDTLREMKALHQGLVGRNETVQDSFFARLLLNDLRRISIKHNTGNVMIDSPGAIQGQTVNIKASKKRISIQAPPGTIGADSNSTAYIQHLIKRYNDFASAHPTRSGRFNYGVISKNLEDKFGSQWRLLALAQADDVIGYLQQRILRTRQALINKGKGWKAFSSFEEFMEKRRK